MASSSKRRLDANRTNAKASTGPKTVAGKAAASKNALRHGLSIPLAFHGPLPERYEALAAELEGGRLWARPAARQAAEARLNMDRIAKAKLACLAAKMASLAHAHRDLAELEAAALVDLGPHFRRLEGYARRHRSVWRKALKVCEQ
jgi:hypothetical protein